MGYISYSKLWKLLEKKNKNKQYLINNGIHRNTLYNLVNNRSVTVEKLCIICELLNCQPGQIMEYIPASKIDSKTPEQPEQNIKQPEHEEDYHKQIQQAQSLEDLQAIINANKAENKAEKNQDKAEEEPF